MNNISILIFTKNEQKDLPDCLKSVSWSDDINIVDSMSADNTVLIAEKFGANVFLRKYPKSSLPFGGDESSHKNWALKNISFKYPWVFTLDADERVTEELRLKLHNAILNNKGEVAFRVRRRDYFMGSWLKYVQTSEYYIRLFKPNKINYERVINPILIVDGIVGDIHGFFMHFPFSKGIGNWIERHNFYSTLEASHIIKNRGVKKLKFYNAFTIKDFNERRAYQKEIFYRLPLRPLLKFIILYLFKKGFLDGRPGFTYALLQAIYEYFIVIKVRELEQSK